MSNNMSQEMEEKMGHPVLDWKQTLNLYISSGARMTYVYLSIFFRQAFDYTTGTDQTGFNLYLLWFRKYI